MSNTLCHWMICYDIHNKSTLQRICRYLKSQALHVQYSVFYAQMSKEDIDDIISQLEDWIDPSTDDIRVYRCQPFSQSEQLGTPCLPETLYL